MVMTLVLAIAALGGDISGPEALGLTIRIPGGKTVEPGRGTKLVVEFRNLTPSPLYVMRSTVVGASELNLQATHGDCSYEPVPFYADLPETMNRYYYVPLLGADRALMEELVLNDPEEPGSVQLPLGRPGRYRLKAHFRSNEHWVMGVFWPIWGGETSSAEIEFELTTASPNSISKWRSRLLDDSPEAVTYFRHVADPAAADTLIGILEKDPVRYGLVPAILKQGRQADAERLMRAAERDGISDARRQLFRGAAETLTKTDACR